MSKEEITVVVNTDSDLRIHLDEWDDGGVWLSMRGNRASIHTPLTRQEAQQLLEGLQSLLAREEMEA